MIQQKQKLIMLLLGISLMFILACGQDPIKLVQTGSIEGVRSYWMGVLSERYFKNPKWEYDKDNKYVTFTAQVDNQKAMSEPYTSAIIAIGYNVDKIKKLIKEYQVETEVIMTFDISEDKKGFSLRNYTINASVLNKQLNKKETHSMEKVYRALLDKVMVIGFPDEQLKSDADYAFFPVSNMFCVEATAGAIAAQVVNKTSPQDQETPKTKPTVNYIGPKIKGLYLGMNIKEGMEACKKLYPDKSEHTDDQQDPDNSVYTKGDNYGGITLVYNKKDGNVTSYRFMDYNQLFNSGALDREEFIRQLMQNYDNLPEEFVPEYIPNQRDTLYIGKDLKNGVVVIVGTLVLVVEEAPKETEMKFN